MRETFIVNKDTRRMPPGYALQDLDDHVQWVLLAGDDDYTEEGYVTWSRAAARAGAWKHYRDSERRHG